MSNNFYEIQMRHLHFFGSSVALHHLCTSSHWNPRRVNFKNQISLHSWLSFRLTCQKIVQNKSTGDISPFPFVSGCLATSLWLRYGFLIQDSSIILVNTVGSTLFFAYVITFYLYSINKVSLNICFIKNIFRISY